MATKDPLALFPRWVDRAINFPIHQNRERWCQNTTHHPFYPSIRETHIFHNTLPKMPLNPIICHVDV